MDTTTTRGPVRRFLETRGTIGGHEVPALEVSFRSGDGTRLAASFLAGPADDAPAVVLVHGFAANRRKPAYARLADGLTRYVHVLSVDLRGHGGSEGRCTLGDREALDVAAGVAWLRARGHGWVAAVGLSMGATAAIHAAANASPHRPDAVVAISAPARLHAEPRTAPMRRLRAAWESPVARTGMRRLLNVDVVPPARWSAPPHPEEAVAHWAGPLLVVHGRDDAYFPIEDARSLASAAAGPTVLWEEPSGFGHAEDGIDQGLIERLGVALASARSAGRFPGAPRETEGGER